MTRLVLFDLDSTLIDRAAAFRVWAEAFAGPEQVAWLEEEDGDGLVTRAAISELAGARKPDRAIFDAAADACGCGLDSAWMVGDSPEADIAGARACGLRSVWIHRGRAWAPELPPPEAVAGSVAEAAEIVLAADRN